jgi:tRNA(fMet)-specific endonuclease VapC
LKYSLDTNACVRYLNGRAPKLLAKVNATPVTEIVVCSVVRAELFYGSSKSNNPVQSLLKQQKFLSAFQSLPFDDSVTSTYAQIRSVLERAGTPIGALDVMIASITMANNLILVTHNVREFSRVSGLQIEDWEI